ncbi:MAG TPA: hypothetical protein VEF06_06010 [Bryobacteraceae bacterium]|nr:hypothetical protein [Bryobacteraceae bacterium]
MLLPTLRRGLRPRARADDRLGRLRKVLDQAGVSYAERNPELALEGLPLASPPDGIARTRLEPFRAPLALPPRVAMLEGLFAAQPPLREFSAEAIRMVGEFEPDALVLPLAVARALAGQHRRPVVSCWMAVLTSLAAPPFEQADRDLLWCAFGVPVFEQLRGWDGTVIARECEVHDGLHVDEAAAIFETREGELIATQLTTPEQPILRARTGLSAELVKEHCECGAETPRIRSLAKIRPKVRYAMA